MQEKERKSSRNTFPGGFLDNLHKFLGFIALLKKKKNKQVE